MNQDLGLKILGQIMSWSDDRAREEFRWLRLMARLKYDGYRDFQAGMRFIESLVTWLQQFKPAERETAYSFVRKTLVYIGPSEMQRLVEQFYPGTVRTRLIQTVAGERAIPSYRVLADPTARAAVDRLRRQTLFMGLSDGARIDIVRHSNAGLLSNEQLVIATQVDKEKWRDLLGNLRADLGDPAARFRLVYLIDDFAGTGTSFFRFNENKRKWTGKLSRFRDSIDSAQEGLADDGIFSPDWELCVHHYVASAGAANRPLTVDASIADGARIHLLHRQDRPYYFGIDTLCDASSENAEQFLQLAARLVSQSETQLIRAKPPTLRSSVQHKLMRERSTEMVGQWDFPHSSLVRRLADGIAAECITKSLEGNASLGGGATGFGIPQDEFSAIPQTQPELARVLQFGVAYNAFVLVPNHGTKRRLWCLIELGGALLVHHGLTLKRGGFLERRTDDLVRLLGEV